MAQEAKKEVVNINDILWRVPEWFPDLKPEVLGQLSKYKELIGKFNRTINLVSPKTLPEMDFLHFADSIMGSQLVGKSLKATTIWDLGSGNGFPGMVFAALNTGVQVKLLDSDERKAEFLKHVASTLALKNVEVICKTIENLPSNSIDTAMCRGLAPIWKSILITKNCMGPSSTLFHFKSLEWMSEVSQIPPQLCAVYTPKLVGNYTLPGGKVEYAVVKTERAK